MRMNESSWILCLCAAVALSACGDDGTENVNDNASNANANENGNGNENDNGNANDNPVCGDGVTLDEMATTDTQLLNCNALGVLDVPIQVTLSAKPLGAVTSGGTTDFEIQLALEIAESAVSTIVGDFGIDEATINEASAAVDAGMGTMTVTVAATAPCDADFTVDPDENGTAGPLVVVAPAVTQGYAESGGAIELRVTDVTFDNPPLVLTTSGDLPPCAWDSETPSVSFAAE